MKYLRYFLIMIIAVIGFVSYTSKNTKPSEGMYPGDLFPSIGDLKNTTGETVDLSDLKGQKILVNFWAAYDAVSRRNNVLLSNLIKEKNYPVKMVSLSFDKSRSVFERTVITDNITDSYQLWVEQDQQTTLNRLYKVKNRFKSFLVDEKGIIMAIDVSSPNLEKLLQEIKKTN